MRYALKPTLLNILACLLALCGAGRASAMEEPGVAVFEGKINRENIAKFQEKYAGKKLNKLVITSFGGSGVEAIEFGDWVRRNHLDVQVRLMCASACANYVFMAGANKIIENNALVLWHGSAEQKNIREMQDEYMQVAARLRDVSSTSRSQDDEYVRAHKSRFDNIERQRRAQAALFSDLKVDESICRLGQEPTDFKTEWWTATPDVMVKFGIRNVQGPDHYGERAYLSDNVLIRTLLKAKVMTFRISDGIVTPEFLVPPAAPAAKQAAQG